MGYVHPVHSPHRFQQAIGTGQSSGHQLDPLLPARNISSFSLSESMGGSTLKSMVVPATGRSPTLAHIVGLSTVPSTAAIGIHPSHTHLGSPIGMHTSWSLMAYCDFRGLKQRSPGRLKTGARPGSSARRGGHLVRRQLGPTPLSEVYGIDNSEGAPACPCQAGAFRTGKRTLDVHSPINARWAEVQGVLQTRAHQISPNQIIFFAGSCLG